MKKVLLASLITFVISLNMHAQIEITPIAGYTFQNSFNIDGGRATLGDGFTWGGMASIRVGTNNEIEILYSRQENQSSAQSRFLADDINEATVVQYYMIGVNKIIPTGNEALSIFTGFKIGAMSLGSLDNNFRTATRFAVQLGAGAKYFVSNTIGLRAGMTLGIPIMDAGAGLWWSPGGGTSVNFSGWSPIVQFGLQGGLIYRLAT